MPADYARMADLVVQYGDFPLGAADASVIAVAERLGITRISTLDHRHFRQVVPKHCGAFDLVPGEEKLSRRRR
ncbi:PIN domain-containing protein [Nocardia sp. CA-084685]|uniref:PIN domain-containing protein n=1 Tax=Nocardia sp. CA-084685 TaxID=3239970 RepID=UPI003D990C26